MGARLADLLAGLSRAIARLELVLAGGLAMAVAGLILLNIATRTAGAALFWVDELAIYAMVWMAFLGASLTIARRSSVSVTILTDALPSPVRRIVLRTIDGVVLAFALFLLWLCWQWYDLPTLAALGFNLDAFTGETFNFIYREPTLTIGVDKFWIWLIVPLAAAAMSVHALANILAGPVSEDRPA